MSKFLETLKDLQVSPNLLHRVVVAEEANARQGTQSTKTRSEVKGGGKKPYKQKKTGNARQGTIRAPHYAHGGVALAVKPRDYAKKVNRKERRLALLGAFADVAAGGNLIVLDKIAFSTHKTKDAVALLAKNGADKVKRVLVIMDSYDSVTYKCFKNIPFVEVRTAPNKDGKGEGFSTRDLILANKVLISKDAMATIESTYTAEPEKVKAPKRAAAPKSERAAVKKEKDAEKRAAKAATKARKAEVKTKPKAEPKPKAQAKPKAEVKEKAAPKAAAKPAAKKPAKKKEDKA